MEKDLLKARGLYAEWKTEDLKQALTVDRDNYDQWTIESLEMELLSRNVKISDLNRSDELNRFDERDVDEEESQTNGGKLFCPKCHSVNIIKRNWRSELRSEWRYILLSPILLAVWLLLEYYNLWFLQIPLYLYVGIKWMVRKKYTCGDCGFRFGILRGREERGKLAER